MVVLLGLSRETNERMIEVVKEFLERMWRARCTDAADLKARLRSDPELPVVLRSHVGWSWRKQAWTCTAPTKPHEEASVELVGLSGSIESQPKTMAYAYNTRLRIKDEDLQEVSVH
ncbi:hypothetical protein E2C01_087527 [Portunus trituberculatus]|uniref:Uncharacterized protein n=1 Tax=Portunus trituberculatus TaxID=210409 RepID=A0A5B7JHJ3_PORTR|nr:hypothetical protein [Portunus trituberculatus]